MLFGVFVLARFRKRLDASVWAKLEAWLDCIDNWETCDQLAKGVAAELVARDLGRLPRLVRWARSPQPWRRRFALATAAALNQGGKQEIEATLEVCEPLMGEREPIVQQAVGWALREASKNDAKRVRCRTGRTGIGKGKRDRHLFGARYWTRCVLTRLA